MRMPKCQIMICKTWFALHFAINQSCAQKIRTEKNIGKTYRSRNWCKVGLISNKSNTVRLQFVCYGLSHFVKRNSNISSTRPKFAFSPFLWILLSLCLMVMCRSRPFLQITSFKIKSSSLCEINVSIFFPFAMEHFCVRHLLRVLYEQGKIL